MQKVISTDKAPSAIGPYSQAIEINGMVYTSGVIPVIPATGEIAEGGVEAQAEQAFKNLCNLVEESGSKVENIVKTTVFIKEMNDFGKINEIYKKYFKEPFPARSCVEVKKINCCMPVLIVSYVFLSSLVSLLMVVAINQLGIHIPGWVSYVISEAVIIVIGLIYIAVMGISIKRDMQYHIIAFKDVIVSILAGYMMIPMVLFINNVSMLFSKNYLEAASQTLLTYPFVVQIILMAVIPALVEEFIFRGLFYGTYRKCGILKGALMSGLVFGLFHLNINQFCYAFVIGVVFAFLVEATGSIWSSVLAHFAINTYSITIIQLLKITGTYDTMQEAAGETVVQSSSISMLLTLAMLLGVSIGFMSLVYLCIKKMAQHNGRWEYIVNDVKSFRVQENAASEQSVSQQRIMTVPAIITVIAVVIYMIVSEIF